MKSFIKNTINLMGEFLKKFYILFNDFCKATELAWIFILYLTIQLFLFFPLGARLISTDRTEWIILGQAILHLMLFLYKDWVIQEKNKVRNKLGNVFIFLSCIFLSFGAYFIKIILFKILTYFFKIIPINK